MTETLFELFPNPSSDVLKIEYKNGKDLGSKTIQLYDAIGNLVFTSSDFTNSEYTIDVTQFMSGIYFLSISNEKTFLHQQKVVILR